MSGGGGIRDKIYDKGYDTARAMSHDNPSDDSLDDPEEEQE